MKVSFNPATQEITVILRLGEPRPSHRGHSVIVASSHGNQPAGFALDGHPTYVSCNVLYFPEERVADTPRKPAGRVEQVQAA